MMVCPTCRQQFPPGSNFCPFDGQKLQDLADAEGERDLFVGSVLDERYKIESRLGSGGMGVVYAARHVVIDKPVAVKILRHEYSKDPRQSERFIREARAASRIGHPNIVDVTDFGRLDNDQIYFVMEFLSGVTLARELRTHGAMSVRRLLNMASQICRALEAAHSKGIIHRDLKPENIFIVNPISAESLAHTAGGRQQDTIKLLDFGIAKITWDQQGRRLTRVGSVFGTPQYMSPEQAAGKDTDHRSDIYALGCILYEMMTGELPFAADTFMGTLTKQMFETPVPPRKIRPDLAIPDQLEHVILKALEKDPDNRYESMREMGREIEACFRHSEMGPVQRAVAPMVILKDGEGPTDDVEPADAEPSTVHLLVEQSPQAQPEPRLEPQLEAQAEFQQETPSPPEDVVYRSRIWPVAGGIALFVALTTTGILLVFKGTSTLDSATVVALAPDARHVPDSRPATDVHLPKTVTILIQTVPVEAEILEEGKAIGLSPFTVTLPKGARKEYTLKMKGYRGKVLPIIANADQNHVIYLQRQPKQIRIRKGTKRTPFGSITDLRNPFSKTKIPAPKKP